MTQNTTIFFNYLDLTTGLTLLHFTELTKQGILRTLRSGEETFFIVFCICLYSSQAAEIIGFFSFNCQKRYED